MQRAKLIVFLDVSMYEEMLASLESKRNVHEQSKQTKTRQGWNTFFSYCQIMDLSGVSLLFHQMLVTIRRQSDALNSFDSLTIAIENVKGDNFNIFFSLV